MKTRTIFCLVLLSLVFFSFIAAEVSATQTCEQKCQSMGYGYGYCTHNNYAGQNQCWGGTTCKYNFESVSKLGTTCSLTYCWCYKLDYNCGTSSTECNNRCGDYGCTGISTPTTLPSSSYNCQDTDNGKNYYLKGSCKAKNQYNWWTDSCSGNKVTEYFCSGTTCKYVKQTCPYGCSNGMCISATATTPPTTTTTNYDPYTDPDGMKRCKFKVHVFDNCVSSPNRKPVGGVAIYVDGVYAGLTDSQGRLDYSNVKKGVHKVKGIKAGHETDSKSVWCNSNVGCCGGAPMWVFLKMPPLTTTTTTTCPPTTCPPTTLCPICYDSDGTNIYVRGFVDGEYCGGGEFRYDDYCINLFTVGEYVCGGSNTPELTQPNCPQGYVCQDGRCVPTTTTTQPYYPPTTTTTTICWWCTTTTQPYYPPTTYPCTTTTYWYPTTTQPYYPPTTYPCTTTTYWYPTTTQPYYPPTTTTTTGPKCETCTLEIYVWRDHIWGTPLPAEIFVDDLYRGFQSHKYVYDVSTAHSHWVEARRMDYNDDGGEVSCCGCEVKEVHLILTPQTTTTTTTYPTTTTTTTSTTTTTTCIICTTSTTTTTCIICTTSTTTTTTTSTSTSTSTTTTTTTSSTSTSTTTTSSTSTSTSTTTTSTTSTTSPSSTSTTTTTTTTSPNGTTTTMPPNPKTLDYLRIVVYPTCVDEPNTIEVLNERDKPVKDADVDVYIGRRKVAYGRTDREGIFEFTPEEVGDYYIKVSKSKYYDEERTIYIPECIALCYNGVKDQNEKDVDCGGICPCCDDGKTCEENDDCCNDYCYKGLCRTPSCWDGVLNQEEEKINQVMSSDFEDKADCGGPNCLPCPTCDDGVQNQGETDIDCGGPCDPCCPTCASCSDGKRNQGETDIDCGGPCSSCYDGEACRIDDDCLSGYCYNQTCMTPSCQDGIQNQEEDEVDCGGPCDPCPGVSIVGSMVRFLGGGSFLLFILLLLLLLLLYSCYKLGKKSGEKSAEGEEIEYILEEKETEETTPFEEKT